jgi:hypothetical protein
LDLRHSLNLFRNPQVQSAVSRFFNGDDRGNFKREKIAENQKEIPGYMIICRTILSGTKLDARSAPAGCAPGMARIKDAKTAKKNLEE